jgi:hypothetical protein
MEAIILKCTKTKSSNTRRRRRHQNKRRRGIRDGRLTTTKSLRSQIEMVTIMHTKEPKATTSMTRRKTPTICSMNRRIKKKRSIYNIFKVRTSNTPTKERRMS